MIDRVQRSLLQLITAPQPITSTELAKRLNVSSRTVVSEMPRVARELERHGARLVSRRNWGYAVHVVDASAYAEFRSYLDMLSMQIEVAGYDETTRFLYIARRLIASVGGVRLETISDELSVSRSTLRIPLRRAYAFLESYHLRIVSVPGRGVEVRGPEHLLRFAMTELFAAHFHKAHLTGIDTGYARIISCDWQERQDIRHAYLEVQRACGSALRDSRTQRVAMLLIISRNRCRDGFRVQFSRAVLDEVRRLPQFEWAQRVLACLAERFEGFSEDEDECALLALYMLDSFVVDASADIHHSPNFLDEDVERVAESVRVRLANELGIDLFSDNQSKALLKQGIGGIVVDAHFGIDGFEHFDHENEKTIRSSPLCMALAEFVTEAVAETLSCRVSPSQTLTLAAILFSRLVDVAFEVKPLRLLVTDGMGTEFARRKGELLRQMFPALIASIHACELYEIRGLNEVDYDAALVDSQDVSYSYVYPMAHLRLVDWRAGFSAIHDELLVGAYQLAGVLFDARHIRSHAVRRQLSLEAALRLVGAPIVGRGSAETMFRYISDVSGRPAVVVDLVREQSAERLDVVHGFPMGRARHVVYAAVAPSVGERHLKAVERLLYLLQDEIPADFDEDPAGSCMRLLRSSMAISTESC